VALDVDSGAAVEAAVANSKAAELERVWNAELERAKNMELERAMAAGKEALASLSGP
jgi:hypothetical protein